MTTTKYDPNRAALERLCAETIAQQLQAVIARRGSVVFAVPGGRSVSGIFSELASRSIDWQDVKIFVVDERQVSLTSDQSNFKLLSHYLIEPLQKLNKLSPDNIFPYDAAQGIEKYQQQLEAVGAKFDVVLLSAGEDGHVAGLFPNHHSIESTAPFFLTMTDSPKPPPERMTTSKRLLAAATYGSLLFFGDGKKQALKNYQDQTLGVTDCPAKIVDLVEQATVYTDNTV